MIFIINMSKVIQTTLVVLFVLACSLHCRHILAGQKLLVYVCIVHVVAAIFDFTTEEDCMRRVEVATLMVGARAKEGKGGGEWLLSPCPLSCSLLTHPISSSLLESIHGTFTSKNICTPEENACTVDYLACGNSI